MSLAIVIHEEIPSSSSEAVAGVIANSEKCKEVHFIYPSYQDDDTSMYAGWLEDREKLEKNGVKVQFDAALNVENFGEKISTIVEVPPQCRLTLGGFESIRQQMDSANESQTHFALSTSIAMSHFSMWNGLFVVLAVIDWLWNRLFEHNKLIQATDVRGRFIVRKGNRRFLPSSTHFVWRIWNSGTIPKVYAANTATLKDPSIVRILHNHTHFTFGLWLFIFPVIWGILSLSWSSMVWAALRHGSIWMGGYAASIWAIEIILSVLICAHYVNIKMHLLFYVLFPLYFAIFPFVLISSKLSK